MSATKSKLLIATLFSLALVAGCVAPSGNYTDIAQPILFSSNATIEWLAENDEPLLRQIVTHNEQVERLAK